MDTLENKNSFYSSEELKELGLGSYGEHVLISRKASIYGGKNIILGSHVRIDDFCILSGKLKLGDYIHIAAYTALYGGDKGITVMDYGNLSSKITIYSVSDDYSGETMTNPLVPEEYKHVVSKPVLLEKHVILGSGCVVLPGVTLKEGSSFGAMTLINRSSEPWSINAGIPFRKLKDRSKALLKLEEIWKEAR